MSTPAPDGTPSSDPAILVVGPSRVSDSVLTQALLKVLLAESPGTAIDVIAPTRILPLLACMPEVRRGIEAPQSKGLSGAIECWRLGRSLRGFYQRAIVLGEDWRTAVVPFAARIPQRSGWRGQLHSLLLNDARRLDTTCHPTTLQRYAALAVGGNAKPPALQVPRFDVRVADVQATMQALGVQKAARRRVLALCPGAEYGPARQWPMLNFAELGRQFAREGWDIWLFGSAGDLAVSEGVAATCKVVTNLVGRTTLRQAADLLSLADAVVANDSGLMHLAAALGRPLVAIYGPSDPVIAPPFSQPSRLVRLGLLCSPCDKRECPLGTTACLVDMPVEQVADALHAVTA